MVRAGTRERPPQGREGPTEKQFQGAVVKYVKTMGWRVYHTWLSAHSTPGFPDLVAVRASRLVVVELKSLTGKLTEHQEGWLGALGAVPCCEVHTFRPTDEDWQEIERVFR